MRIPDQKIDEIRSATDIVELIGAVTRLRKRGKNFIGLCPFHQEKTPSFTVSADKQMFHCFGCGKGGNVFTFVMELEKVSFVEAVRSLAERAGIAITTESGGPRETENEHLLAACRFAAEHFYRNLHAPEGVSALEYLRSRGFTDATMKRFGLGYSKNAWDGLLAAAVAENISPDLLVRAGLVRAREGAAGHYDYFRGRVMFPIFTPTGRVIAFGARKLRDDDPIQGKYINSPETPLYNKSRVLFGLFQAKEAIRAEETALMVEGYVDMISLFQAGIENVVASSGTALTEEQVRLVGRYARTLTLVYDADSAGSQAMVRGLDVALEQGLDVRIVSLPDKHDPDSFVRKAGAREFRTLLAGAQSFIDFKAGMFLASGRLATPEGRTEAVRSIVQSIAKIRDELKRNFFVKEVADKYQIYESVLFRELERWMAGDRPPARPSGLQRPGGMPSGRPEAAPMIPAAERDVVKILFEKSGEAVRFILDSISVDELTNAGARSLVQMAMDQIEDHGSVDTPAAVNSIADPGLKGLLTEVLMNRYELSKGWQDRAAEWEEPDPLRIARAAVAAIRKHTLNAEIERNQRLLREASQRGEETVSFVRRHQELLTAVKELEKQAQSQ